jgi:hypothetical protein
MEIHLGLRFIPDKSMPHLKTPGDLALIEISIQSSRVRFLSDSRAHLLLWYRWGCGVAGR